MNGLKEKDRACPRTPKAGSGWSSLAGGRVKHAAALPQLLKLPIVPSARGLLARLLKDGDRVLDVGANDRNLERFLIEKGVKAEYKSCDVDTGTAQDFYGLDTVTGEFDAIAAFEVIEHVSPVEAAAIIAAAMRLLRDGGVFVVSTPNVCHPVVFWRDCTHITPFRYDELYGMLTQAGFSGVQIYRTGTFSLKDRLVALLYRPLLRLLRMDFAPGIAAVATKGRRA